MDFEKVSHTNEIKLPYRIQRESFFFKEFPNGMLSFVSLCVQAQS